jgi:chromosome segregation ATPase
MPGNGRRKPFVQALVIAVFVLLHSPLAQGQNAAAPPSPGAAPAESAPTPDIRALADSVRALQAQVQSLNSQVSALRAAEEREHAEARALRSELNRATAKSVRTPDVARDAYASAASPENTAPTAAAAVAAAGPATRVPRLRSASRSWKTIRN